jgi:hypothetical protein
MSPDYSKLSANKFHVLAESSLSHVSAGVYLDTSYHGIYKEGNSDSLGQSSPRSRSTPEFDQAESNDCLATAAATADILDEETRAIQPPIVRRYAAEGYYQLCVVIDLLIAA